MSSGNWINEQVVQERGLGHRYKCGGHWHIGGSEAERMVKVTKGMRPDKKENV